MANIIIPVALSFFLGPGAGQLYNREFKKGALLIVGSLIILVVFFAWLFKAAQPFLPTDLTGIDPQAAQGLMRNALNQVSDQNGSIVAAFEALMVVLWLYGVVDAYLVAEKKRRVL